MTNSSSAQTAPPPVLSFDGRTEAMQALIAQMAHHRQRIGDKPNVLSHMFTDDKHRLATMSVQMRGLYADFSKQLIDLPLLNALLAFAKQSAWRQTAAAMYNGALVNSTEQRAVEHMGLRSQPIKREFVPAFAQLGLLVRAIHAGEKRTHSNERFTDVVHLGIGGSHLGPELVCEALRHDPKNLPKLKVHFLANIDAHLALKLLASLNPKTTAVVVASKTMGTLETRLNFNLVSEWLAPQGGIDSEQRRAKQIFAVSAAPEKAIALGIAAKHVLPFADSIGGRFSLWSGIGLPIALQIGWDGFSELLAGAREMDTHFMSAPEEKNMVVLAALIGLWNRNGLGFCSLCIAAYDERLRLLPAFLQQLDMESNGKRVDRQGKPVNYATGPVIWGQTGTPGQHAFFQHLHQSTSITPVDFVACVQPDHRQAVQHRALLENCFAQSRALMLGNTAQTDPEISAQVFPPLNIDNAAHKQFPGNRPSSTYLLDRLSPNALGSLLALYEHKVFLQGYFWNINSFDQFGVELGKSMAQSLASGDTKGLDASTLELLRRTQAA